MTSRLSGHRLVRRNRIPLKLVFWTVTDLVCRSVTFARDVKLLQDVVVCRSVKFAGRVSSFLDVVVCRSVTFARDVYVIAGCGCSP